VTLVLTFGVCLVSALIPLVNAEAYLVALGVATDPAGLWLIAFVAGLGQTAGKLIWYEVGRRALTWSFTRRKMSNPKAQRLRKLWHDRLEARPVVSGSVLFLAASVGIPPLFVMAVVAGQLEINRVWFTIIVLVGRTLRFAAVLGGLAWVMDALRGLG
jgi:membrane protein YqaA with SNARE-associated domain